MSEGAVPKEMRRLLTLAALLAGACALLCGSAMRQAQDNQRASEQRYELQLCTKQIEIVFGSRGLQQGVGVVGTEGVRWRRDTEATGLPMNEYACYDVVGYWRQGGSIGQYLVVTAVIKEVAP